MILIAPLETGIFNLSLAVSFLTAEALLSQCTSYQGVRWRGGTTCHRVILGQMGSVRQAWGTCKVVVSLWARRKKLLPLVSIWSVTPILVGFHGLMPCLPHRSAHGCSEFFHCKGSAGKKYRLGSLGADILSSLMEKKNDKASCTSLLLFTYLHMVVEDSWISTVHLVF